MKASEKPNRERVERALRSTPEGRVLLAARRREEALGVTSAEKVEALRRAHDSGRGMGPVVFGEFLRAVVSERTSS